MLQLFVGFCILVAVFLSLDYVVFRALTGNANCFQSTEEINGRRQRLALPLLPIRRPALSQLHFPRFATLTLLGLLVVLTLYGILEKMVPSCSLLGRRMAVTFDPGSLLAALPIPDTSVQAGSLGPLGQPGLPALPDLPQGAGSQVPGAANLAGQAGEALKTTGSGGQTQDLKVQAGELRNKLTTTPAATPAR